MEFQYRYLGDSQVHSGADRTQMNFVPDSLRAPTHFKGRLSRKLPFREAISALHEVVESDMRYKPRDLSDYKAWLASQGAVFLAEAAAKKKTVQERLGVLRKELAALEAREHKILSPFYEAQRKYFKYLYTADIDAWFVLDPVITVHPDAVFFECFSQDESSYGRLSCDYATFDQLGERACGTTNVDYSHALYQAFQKIRDYKDTELNIDPSGFEVQTGVSESFKEEKIDLPDSWVRGFLQVSSAMTMPLIELELHPMDLY
ncbi:MAG: SWIM zinc finger family protein, partial [Candidatus Sericytochromatia bacterium]